VLNATERFRRRVFLPEKSLEYEGQEGDNKLRMFETHASDNGFTKWLTDEHCAGDPVFRKFLFEGWNTLYNKGLMNYQHAGNPDIEKACTLKADGPYQPVGNRLVDLLYSAKEDPEDHD
jgi:hypothetical protein